MLCGLLLLLTHSLARLLGAQTNSPAVAGPSNRYLLIIDTSGGMKSRADGTLKATQDLLASGMGGMASSCRNFIQTVENTLAEMADDIKHHNRQERHRFQRRN